MQKILDDLMRSAWWVAIILVILYSAGIGRIGHTRIPLQVKSIELKAFDGKDYVHSIQYEDGKTILVKGLDSYSIKKIEETGYMYIKRDEDRRLAAGIISLFFLVPILCGAIGIEDWEIGNPVRFFVTTDSYKYSVNYSTLVRLAALFIMLYYAIYNFFGGKKDVYFDKILENIK